MVAKRLTLALLVCLSPLAVAKAAEQDRQATSKKASRLFRKLENWSANEAHQAVAVDAEHFYAVANTSVAKFSKQSGELIKRWMAPESSPLRHLNSGLVLDGRLYCAHSNWPQQPYLNTVEMWDVKTMEHAGRHEFKDPHGALTWVDYHNESWWAVFAHYGEETEVRRTTLFRLDDQWRQQETWRFPDAVIDRFVPYSNSGGSWGPDGLLYTTGHDLAETYALRVPRDSDLLQLVETLPAPITGQGISWDRTDIGVMFGIRRKTKEVVVSRISHNREFEPLLQSVSWKRDARNPVLAPSQTAPFEATRCMNPWVVRQDNQYQLYYSGGDTDGRQRICLATAPVTDPASWTRHGPLFETGRPGTFDARWCVLPHVVQFAPDRWHMYYTGNAGRGSGLSAFPGIGLAISRDANEWKRHSDRPVLAPSGHVGDSDAIGIAGGSLLRLNSQDGKALWRFYYTGCPTTGSPLHLNQQKTICLAVSSDGVSWTKRGAVMYRDPTRDYEDIAVAGPVVRQNENGTYRMWYSAIGTRWGYYSICYAESDDGIAWRRGRQYGDNLQLTPSGDGWERQMVEYPSIIDEGDHLRLFYCGNGYGRTGIGTAVSQP